MVGSWLTKENETTKIKRVRSWARRGQKWTKLLFYDIAQPSQKVEERKI